MTHFAEMGGGVIVSKQTGIPLLKIAVEQLLIEDSVRIRDAVLAALEKEFSNGENRHH